MATQSTQFSYVTFLEAKQALALRLADTGMVFTVDAELGAWIGEALSFWNCLTQLWAQSWEVTLDADSSTWNSANVSGSPRYQTYTDQTIYSWMEYHLLEPQSSGGTWNGTSQFSLDDLLEAVQRRRDEILQRSACNMGILTSSVTPGTNQIYLPDTTLDVRRVRYVPVQGNPATLVRGDGLAFQRFTYSYQQTSAQPLQWDVLSGPPLSVILDANPNQPSSLEILAIQAGNTLEIGAAMPLQIPNDWGWVVKFGALADVLSREPEATDRERAAYCEKRYQGGLKLIEEMPWLLQAFVNKVPVDTPSVISQDRYSYEWESNPDAFPGIVVGGIDLFAVSPIPAVSTGVNLALVGNAPQPASDSAYLEVPRDVLDKILDYAQHLACFKMGGADFTSTMPLYQGFIEAALKTNARLRRSGIFATDLRPPVSKQSLDEPRFEAQGA